MSRHLLAVVVAAKCALAVSIVAAVVAPPAHAEPASCASSRVCIPGGWWGCYIDSGATLIAPPCWYVLDPSGEINVYVD